MLYDEHQIAPKDAYFLIVLVQLNQDVYRQDYYQYDLQVLYVLFEHYDLDDEIQYLDKRKENYYILRDVVLSNKIEHAFSIVDIIIV